MRYTRRLLQLSLILALGTGVSCSTGEVGTTEPSVPVSESVGLPAPPGSIDTITVANLLVCSEQRYEKTTARVGPKGAKIGVGRHLLTIPAGALSKNVTITAEQVTGAVNSVRLSPEGLRFATPASLRLEYRNCASVRPKKRVAYTDELLKVLELPPSEDYPEYEYVTAEIDHFSRYAVAY
ncbi:MAG TPA: hypothetical protein VFH26_06410 [Gemmatimonadales bacterium]|nr:hypothetical protein [Gemmatimonadales bacterium]